MPAPPSSRRCGRRSRIGAGSVRSQHECRGKERPTRAPGDRNGRSRLAATCGALFAVVLFVAADDGKEAYLAPRAIARLAALTLFIPFLAYLCSVLRAAEGPNGRLGSTALAAGITGITLKIASVIPALALHRSHVTEGTTLHKLVDGVDNALAQDVARAGSRRGGSDGGRLTVLDELRSPS